MRCFRVLALLLASHGLFACELIADFDRGKLDAGRPVDAGTPPVPPDDQPSDDAGSVEPDAGR
jgi:hypothetical protein